MYTTGIYRYMYSSKRWMYTRGMYCYKQWWKWWHWVSSITLWRFLLSITWHWCKYHSKLLKYITLTFKLLLQSRLNYY
jgi:hypothetical protein